MHKILYTILNISLLYIVNVFQLGKQYMDTGYANLYSSNSLNGTRIRRVHVLTIKL